MANPSVTYTFSNGTTADASQVNQNFTDLINSLTDTTKSISIAAGTFASTLTANGNVVLGASSANTLTLNASIATSVPFSANTSWDIGSSTLGAKSLYIGGSSTFTVRLLGGTQAASYTLTLPTAVPGTANSLIQSDTSGVLSFTATPSVTTLSTTGAITVGTGGAVVNNVGTDLNLGAGIRLGGNTAQITTSGGNITTNAPVQIQSAGYLQKYGSTLNSLQIVDSTGTYARGVVTAANGPSPIGSDMIIRGQVGLLATAIAGNGFTASTSDGGTTFTVTYTAGSFADVPTTVITPKGLAGAFYINSSSTGAMTCLVNSNVAGFFFIAIGPRGN